MSCATSRVGFELHNSKQVKKEEWKFFQRLRPETSHMAESGRAAGPPVEKNQTPAGSYWGRLTLPLPHPAPSNCLNKYT